MKNWQVLIGLMAIAVAILISGILISNAIQEAGSNIHVGFMLWVSSLDNHKPMICITKNDGRDEGMKKSL